MMERVIYKAGHGWRGKTLSLLSAAAATTFFVSYPDTLIKFWQESGWIWRTFEIFALSTIVLVPLESFVSRTVFTDALIKHRSMFGIEIIRTYADVVKLLRDTYFLNIQFEDGKKVKIWRSKGDLGRIVSVIQNHVGKPVPIEPAR